MFFIVNDRQMPPADMSMYEHLNELRVRIFHIAICVAIITIFCLSFGIRPLNNSHLFFPFPDPINNIAVQLTSYMRDTLLPPEVKLIQTAPGQAFFAQIYVGMLIGVLGSMPIIVKEIFGFISPAFDKQFNKGLIVAILLPTIVLFISGIILSYVLVIPFTLGFLYKYGQAIGVETFFNITDFISFVLQFFLGFGIAFELPIIMYAFTLTGLVDVNFWKKNFRYAVIILVIFGAIITPDGSGITMWFITGPMIALYLIGIVFIQRREKNQMRMENIT
ncbi:MAG: twin-arginine translocase subunit TatC [Nitrososphaeraceae archaeon]|jgi:sec-independent protein translocase protein TatC